MKVLITQRGASGPDGPFEVGKEYNLKASNVPGYLLGKCMVVGTLPKGSSKKAAATEKTRVANPAASAVPAPPTGAVPVVKE